MKFLDYKKGLLDELQRRIERGELSVSLLARKTGMGQGHLSNFLRGRRELTMASLDRILEGMGIDLRKFVPDREVARPRQEGIVTLVPLVSHSAAMFDAVIERKEEGRVLPVPSAFLNSLRAPKKLDRRSWDRFVAIEVGEADVSGMEAVLTVGTMLVLDRHYNSFWPYRGGQPGAQPGAQPGSQPGAKAGGQLVTAVEAAGLNPLVAQGNLSAVRVGSKLVLAYGEYKSGIMTLRPYWIGRSLEVVPVASREMANDLVVGRVVLRVGGV